MAQQVAERCTLSSFLGSGEGVCDAASEENVMTLLTMLRVLLAFVATFIICLFDPGEVQRYVYPQVGGCVNSTQDLASDSIDA